MSDQPAVVPQAQNVLPVMLTSSSNLPLTSVLVYVQMDIYKIRYRTLAINVTRHVLHVKEQLITVLIVPLDSIRILILGQFVWRVDQVNTT